MRIIFFVTQLTFGGQYVFADFWRGKLIFHARRKLSLPNVLNFTFSVECSLLAGNDNFFFTFGVDSSTFGVEYLYIWRGILVSAGEAKFLANCRRG